MSRRDRVRATFRMPEWLASAIQPDVELTAGAIVVRLGVTLVLGGAVALVHRASHGRDSVDSNALSTTLVLLAVLIAMVTMVIGNSVARAFSLVGALSIVRFRTAVADTRDTAFVIFAVIVGMAAGSASMLLPAIGVPIVGAAAIVLSRLQGFTTTAAAARCALTVRLGLDADPEEILRDTLARHARWHRLIGTRTARQGQALEVTYAVRPRSIAAHAAIVKDLHRTVGVQGVELRRT